MQKKRVLFVIAHETFRDEEYQIPRSILENEGKTIIVASTQLSPATGKNGLKVVPDIIVKNVKPVDYDAVVFVGGAGCKKYWHDPDAHAIVKGFYSSGKLTTAICSAPVILAYAKILEEKQATCFPADKEHLVQNMAHYIDEEVVIDGNIVTAKDYLASEKFGKALLNELRRQG